MAGDIDRSRQTWFEICAELATEKFDNAAYDKCFADRFAPTGLGWDDWWLAAGGTLVVCAILYGLIWLIVWTIKWVWRGRETQE